MKGFAKEALLLFPKAESYDQRSYEYKNNFKIAVRNLTDYLTSQEIKPHILYTDDVAREVCLPEMQYVSTLGSGDLFFTFMNCEGMKEFRSVEMIRYEDAYLTALHKVPMRKDATMEERFSDVLHRADIASREIIKKYRIVLSGGVSPPLR